MGIINKTKYNLISTIIPIVVSLVTVPIYIKNVGLESYGVLAVVWLILGYFGFFDLGLPRATSNLIAKMKSSSTEERQEVIFAALFLNLNIGLIGSIIVYCVTPYLIKEVFEITDKLRNEILDSLVWISLSIPITTISGVLVGTLDGRERFNTVNYIQVISTIIFQVLPIIVFIYLNNTLEAIISTSFFIKLLTALTLYKFISIEFNSKIVRIKLKWLKKLLSYGGWVTITNAIIPILENTDRFLIGSLIGAKELALYTIAFNLVNRLRILPGVIHRTIFPMLSSLEKDDAKKITIDAMQTLTVIMTPLILITMLFIHPFIEIWIGKDVADKISPIAITLLLGIWINSIGNIPFAFVEANGRPDLIAKLHIFTLPLFIFLLWLGAHWNGLMGVALAWTARVWIDTNILFKLAGVAKIFWSRMWVAGVLIVTGWIVSYNEINKYYIGVILINVSLIWAYTVDHNIKNMMRKILNKTENS